MAITIKDVAARCGLSVSTVSKAFNHYCDISEHTREMVQRTAPGKWAISQTPLPAP